MSSILPVTPHKEIRVLAVRQPWASLIVEGLKTIEVRSRPTKIRGKILIYASNTKLTENEKSLLYEHFTTLDVERRVFHHVADKARDLLHTSEYGKILGSVELTQSFRCWSIGDYDEYIGEHLAPYEYFKLCSTEFWAFQNPVRFSTPIKYTPPRGAVVWSKTVLPEGY